MWWWWWWWVLFFCAARGGGQGGWKVVQVWVWVWVWVCEWGTCTQEGGTDTDAFTACFVISTGWGGLSDLCLHSQTQMHVPSAAPTSPFIR